MERVEQVNPYNEKGEKSEQVEAMFDSIAPAYDFMNTAMTLGLHKYWRNAAIRQTLKMFGSSRPEKILDLATGTGDLVFNLHGRLPQARITGLDLSSGMLEIAGKKLLRLNDEEKKLISFEKGDCLALPFADSSFSLITVAYGVRNFSNLLAGLKEMRRVLASGGVLCVIELSEPKGRLTRGAYRFYSRRLIPALGRMKSGDSRAYSYLPESIAACPQREDMARLMKEAGFNDVRWHSLTLGAVTYYLAT